MSEIEDTLMSIALGIGQTSKEGKENMEIENKQKRPRGFASMSPERRREIASKGGQAAQARGKAHQWTAEEASAAGKKGSARYARHRAAEKQPAEE